MNIDPLSHEVTDGANNGITAVVVAVTIAVFGVYLLMFEASRILAGIAFSVSFAVFCMGVWHIWRWYNQAVSTEDLDALINVVERLEADGVAVPSFDVVINEMRNKDLSSWCSDVRVLMKADAMEKGSEKRKAVLKRLADRTNTQTMLNSGSQPAD